MVFEIENKIALITGGASGIGFQSARKLLQNGARGVVIADINADVGVKAVKTLENEFGTGKAIFSLTDVSNKQNFEDSFKKTVETFNNLDILINGAGVLNDAKWENEIKVNVNGVVHGMLLGLDEYIPKYKSGEEGVIVNVSSTASLINYIICPVYSGTKLAICGMSLAWGSQIHYDRTKVKTLGICPGPTVTPLFTEFSGRTLGPPYEELLEEHLKIAITQTPEFVADSLIKIIKHGETGTIWVVEHSKEAYQYILLPRKTFAPPE